MPKHFSAMARRSSEPPISWLMKAALDRPGLISLAAGFTDNETLPVREVAALTQEIFRDRRAGQKALQYGSTIGLPRLRQELLRRWRQQDQQTGLNADDVIVTNGSQQLLYLVSEVLCDPGDIVLVEDPTYFVYLGIIEAMGIRAAAFDSLTNLKAKLQTLQSRGLLGRVKLIYLVTYFRNPTGHTWPLDAKREALAIVKHYERAAGHPIYLFDDAAYRDLRFDGVDVPSFKALDPRNDRVIYTNTLTKPFATGLKVGFGILPRALLRPVVRSKANQDFGTANFLQEILARALAEGMYERHLPVIAAAYRKKRDAMVAAIETAFPKTTRFEKPQGGLYVWTELAPRTNTGANSRLFRRALDAGVLYVPGALCFCTDPSRPIPQNCMRLTFGTQPVELIRQGIKLVAEVLP